jgi:hypothetical protein
MGDARAKVIRVIEVWTTRGSGSSMADPVRTIAQYFAFDGELLAERDPHLMLLAESRSPSREGQP